MIPIRGITQPGTLITQIAVFHLQSKGIRGFVSEGKLWQYAAFVIIIGLDTPAFILAGAAEIYKIQIDSHIQLWAEIILQVIGISGLVKSQSVAGCACTKAHGVAHFELVRIEQSIYIVSLV